MYLDEMPQASNSFFWIIYLSGWSSSRMLFPAWMLFPPCSCTKWSQVLSIIMLFLLPIYFCSIAKCKLLSLFLLLSLLPSLSQFNVHTDKYFLFSSFFSHKSIKLACVWDTFSYANGGLCKVRTKWLEHIIFQPGGIHLFTIMDCLSWVSFESLRDDSENGKFICNLTLCSGK